MFLDRGQQHRLAEEYKGYQIIHYINSAKHTDYFYIRKGDERVSILCLYSIVACKNVINTMLRNNVNQIWR